MWLYAIPILVTLCYLLEIIHINKFHSMLLFMGAISLESYLTNAYVGYICRHYICWDALGNINYGHYFEYTIVIIVGVFVAWIANTFYHKLIA